METFDRIHIDENSFYNTKTSSLFNTTLGESEPLIHCKSKCFITNLMFMETVVKPRWKIQIYPEMFDRKIGIWLFVFTKIEKN